MTGLVNAVYLDFRKAFNIVSHSILIVKLMKYVLDKRTMNQQAQMVLNSNTKSWWTKLTSGVPLRLVTGANIV